MNIGVLGTGMVGETIGKKLLETKHKVMLGSRTVENEAATKWASVNGKQASHGTFADAATFGEVIFNCTAGTASLAALELAGTKNLDNKTLIDVSNPLDFSQGTPPTLSVANTGSLGEQIQKTFPGTRVVKAFNTMSCQIMVNPWLVPGKHNVFLCGDSEVGKFQVRDIIRSFGWPEESILDLGDITGARGLEMYLPLWLRMFGTVGTPNFNISVLHA